jgi:hypothetical protein
MTKEQISKQIRHIINLDKKPLFKGTAIAHLQALLGCIENDNSDLEQVLTEYSQPTPEPVKLNDYRKEDFILKIESIIEHLDSILELEFEPLINEKNSMESKSQFDSMRKRILKKLLQTFTKRMTPVVPVIQVHAVYNVALANKKMRKDNLIENAFAGIETENEIQHLKEMFEGHNYDIFPFLEALSETQIAVLINYIMKNYNGVKISDIEKHVQ